MLEDRKWEERLEKMHAISEEWLVNGGWKGLIGAKWEMSDGVLASTRTKI